MQRLLSRRDVTRIAAGSLAVASLPLAAFAPASVAVLASDATATPAGGSFTDLGLQTLDLKVSANGVEGLPETLAAGRYVLHLEPGDMLPNDTMPGVFFAMLPDGITMDDLAAMASTPMPGPPDWYYTTTLPGGVSAAPGQAGDAVIDLKAGNWFASGPELSTPPVGLTVTGDSPSDVKDPAANATITLKEYTIEVTDGALQAGQNIIKLENVGTEPHFVELFKGPDDMTKEQLDATINVAMTGTPTADALDFSTLIPVFESIDQSAGTTQWAALSLEAGAYAGVCWVGDPKTGAPHAAMGMYNLFIVK
jgi:hypothetical protein